MTPLAASIERVSHTRREHRRVCMRSGSVLLAGTLLLSPVACSNEPTQRSGSGELRIPLSRDVRTLDPSGGHAEEVLTHNVVRQLYEGLVEYDPHTLAVAPRIAHSWSVSEDNRTWVFDLSPNVRFIDDACFPSGRGRDIDANDVKYSIERGIASSYAVGRTAGVPRISGIDAYLEQRESHIEGIRVLSPDRVEIELTHGDPNLPHYLTRPACYIVPREAVERYGERFARHPVGTGPFRLVHWRSESGIRLVRNHAYWRPDEDGAQLPYLDAVHFIRVSDDFAPRRFALGELDVFFSYLRRQPADPTQDSAAGAEQERQYFVTWLNTIYVRFNFRSDHPAVRDPLVRKALSYAVPRRGHTRHVPAGGLLPPGLPGHDPDLDGQRTDADAARELLARAGYPGGAGLPAVRLAWPDWALGWGNRTRRELESQLGLDIDFRILDTNEFFHAVAVGEVDLFRDGWVADFPDPQNFLQLFHSQSSDNHGHYANDEFDALFEELAQEIEPQVRYALARRMEKLLLDDTAAMFMRHERQMQFVSPAIQGWEGNCTNPMNQHYYERVSLRRSREPHVP